MLLWASTPEIRNLKAVQLQDVANPEYLNTRYPPQADTAEISGPSSRDSRLAIRREIAGATRMDFIARAYLTILSTRVQLVEYFGKAQFIMAIVAPI